MAMAKAEAREAGSTPRWDESCHFWYTSCTVRSTLTNTHSRVTNVAHSTPTIYLEQLSASDGRQQLHELLEGRHGHGKAGLESS